MQSTPIPSKKDKDDPGGLKLILTLTTDIIVKFSGYQMSREQESVATGTFPKVIENVQTFWSNCFFLLFFLSSY